MTNPHSILPGLFFIEGPCADQAYLNTRDQPSCETYKRFVEELWVKCHHLTDSNIREAACSQFLQRLWEMYLAVALLEQGFELKRHGGKGPEFYAVAGNRTLWFEAIAPGPGDGPDRVPEPVLGEAGYVPTNKFLMRFTNALSEKRIKYRMALADGIIAPEDQYVLAINCRRIPHAAYGNTMPYFIQAFLPFGPLTVALDKETLQLKETFYPYRPDVSKLNGSSVSTRAFLDEQGSFCSAVLHSSVDPANRPGKLGGDFSVLHNPNAKCPVDRSVFDWCEQYWLKGEYLHRSNPETAAGA